MQDFQTILDNEVLLVALGACLIAQVIKAGVELLKNGKINIRYLVSTGGMPSAHSALVGSLATGVGLKSGWGSTEFAVAAIFAVIVMYDAAGVRQAAGKQARILNQLLDEFFQSHKQFNEERLKELLGHTPVQVFVGLALGVAISLAAFWTYPQISAVSP